MSRMTSTWAYQHCIYSLGRVRNIQSCSCRASPRGKLCFSSATACREDYMGSSQSAMAEPTMRPTDKRALANFILTVLTAGGMAAGCAGRLCCARDAAKIWNNWASSRLFIHTQHLVEWYLRHPSKLGRRRPLGIGALVHRFALRCRIAGYPPSLSRSAICFPSQQHQSHAGQTISIA